MASEQLLPSHTVVHVAPVLKKELRSERCNSNISTSGYKRLFLDSDMLDFYLAVGVLII